jgi:FAD/FMN-containing dehydrogenase
MRRGWGSWHPRCTNASVKAGHLGGREDFVARCAADDRIDAKFARTDIPRLKKMLVDQVTQANSMWTDPTADDLHATMSGEFAAAVASFSGGVYVNFLGEEGDARIRAAYGDAKYEHLARLKRRFDPENLFRLNQNIPPAP